MRKCILVGAGDCGCIRISPQMEEYVIAADAGVVHCHKAGIVPDLCVGDWDSLEEYGEDTLFTERNSGTEVIGLPVEKDDTDLLYAARCGLEKGFREFDIYGALGGDRISHSIANLQLLLFLKEHGANGTLMYAQAESGRCTQIQVIRNEKISLPGREGEWLSVFAVGRPAEGVTLSGVKYLLDHACITPDYPIGVSNHFVSSCAEIEVLNGTLLLVREWNPLV